MRYSNGSICAGKDLTVQDNLGDFDVPAPGQMVPLLMRDGAEIRLRRYGDSTGLRLVLSHGNGLAINSYAPFWLSLTDQFDVIVFDVRNHGENPRHAQKTAKPTPIQAHLWLFPASNRGGHAPKPLKTRVRAVVVNRTSTYFRHVSDLN